MDWQHFKAIFWITVFGVLAGVYLSSGNIILIFLGIISLILDVFYEYYYLKEMDTRDDVKQTKKELKRYVDEVKSIKKEVDKSEKEIKSIKNKVFDIFSQKGFKTIEERLKDLEEQVEGKYGNEGLSKVKEDVTKIKHKLNIWP